VLLSYWDFWEQVGARVCKVISWGLVGRLSLRHSNTLETLEAFVVIGWYSWQQWVEILDHHPSPLNHILSRHRWTGGGSILHFHLFHKPLNFNMKSIWNKYKECKPRRSFANQWPVQWLITFCGLEVLTESVLQPCAIVWRARQVNNITHRQ